MRWRDWKACRKPCAKRPTAWACHLGSGCARSSYPWPRPVILAGIRVSVTIAIGTATIGSTVGALTLGTPIFDGLVANKLPFVIEGAVLVALFAILTDMLFGRLDRWLRRGAAG